VFIRRLSGLLFAVAFVSCGGSSSTSPTPTPTPLPSAPYSQTDLVVGTGAEAVAGKIVTINYSLWLYSDTAPDHKGTALQTTVGSTPYSFTLGASQVIPGVDQGVTGMKVGGSRRLIIPPELAYGSTGSGTLIPANATLVFDIDLLVVQ
jgi:FKBP-type peptidyl-prolyl cis-trans isomerase